MKLKVQRLCALLALSLQVIILAPVEAIPELPAPEFDKRVADLWMFKDLSGASRWEQVNKPPTDWSQTLRGCIYGISNTPGGYNARRAENLTATKHYAEALREWTIAIDSYDDPSSQIYGMTLEPAWLISRARIYLLLGFKEKALADIERSLTLKRSYEQAKFRAAILLGEMGEYSRAEAILPVPSSVSPLYQPYFFYMLAVVQRKLGKTELAKQNFLEAATLFAAAGMSAPAQACLVSLDASNDSLKATPRISDLVPPQANYEKIEKLLKSLATRSDVFDIEVLKGLTGVAEFRENDNGYFVIPYGGHYKEISSLTIDKLKTGGKRLNIQLEPMLCSVNKSALQNVLKKQVESQAGYRNESTHSEAYAVPAGTLLLSSYAGGFKSLFHLTLYSKEATFPEPPQTSPVQQDDARRKAYERHEGTRMLLESGNFENAQKIVSEWLRDAPEDPRAHMYQAEIYCKRGKFEDALVSINTAIKYGSNDQLLKDKYTGDVLQIRRGAYLLELGRYAEALGAFGPAFPEKPSADQLVLRARAEIGLKQISEGVKDLRAASGKFYEEGRIVRRDETEKLLESVEEKSTKSLNGKRAIPVPVDSADYLNEERERAMILMRRLSEEKKERELACAKHSRGLIEGAVGRIIFSAPLKQVQKNEYILALLEMARTAEQLKQIGVAQSYVDKAIECYETYTPQDRYDASTRILVPCLRLFKGQPFLTRFERVARRSELFCNNESFKSERDEAFHDLSGHVEARMAIVEKLIEIREELQPKTQISAKSLYLWLPLSYKGKGGYKEMVDYFINPVDQKVERLDSTEANQFAAAAQALNFVERVLAKIQVRDFNQSEMLIEGMEHCDYKSASKSEPTLSVLSEQYVAFSRAYLEQSSSDLADASLRKAIDALDVKSQDKPWHLIDQLNHLQVVYADRGQFRKAVSLDDYALLKLSHCVNLQLESAAEIRNRLAETLLNQARHLADKNQAAALQNRAAKLFEMNSQDFANRNEDEGSLAALRLRREIATKYPALGSLNLSDGVVVYEEPGARPTSMRGVAIDGRRVEIEGPTSIAVHGKGGGRLSIVLDGQTLSEKAQVEISKGNLPRAEKLLESALRADPASKSFGMLADCWYRQGRFAEALQAASMALDLDNQNAQAQSIQRRCKSKLK